MGLWILLCSGLWILYFFGLNRTGLLGPDEPRYAAIGQAMAQSGDWVTPRLWGKPWFEKPALLYWMTAAAFQTGLDVDLAPRLPVAITSVAFLVGFFFIVRKQFGDRASVCALTILATCAGWLVYSHVAVPDLPMSAAFSTAMLLLLPSPALTLRRAAAAGLCLGIAILGKGLVPLILSFPVVWFLRKQFRALLLVFSVAFAVALPWYLLAALRNGAGFFNVFFGQQQFARFLSGEFLHAQPFWFYIPVLLGGLFPWTPLVALLLARRLYSDERVVFLVTWFAFGFLFFSASRGKLPGYLLPLIPPLAALIGIALDRARDRSVANACLIAASASLLWLLPTAEDALPNALVSGLRRTQLHFFPVWLLPVVAVAGLCAVLELRGRRTAAVSAVALSIALLIARFVWRDFPLLDRTASARSVWIDSSRNLTCIAAGQSFLRFGLAYYAGRELEDCH